MRLLENLLSDWQRLTCNHRWVRARWVDGSYGLRCAHCMKAYAHTWNEILAQPPAGTREFASLPAESELAPLRRAA